MKAKQDTSKLESNHKNLSLANSNRLVASLRGNDRLQMLGVIVLLVVRFMEDEGVFEAEGVLALDLTVGMQIRFLLDLVLRGFDPF